MKLLTLTVAAIALMSVQAHACNGNARTEGSLLKKQTCDKQSVWLPAAAQGTPVVQLPNYTGKSAADVVASPVKTK